LIISDERGRKSMSVFTVPRPKPVPPFVHAMVFIDGGYLRNGFRELLGHDKINFEYLVEHLVASEFEVKPFKGEVTRVYYYDAIVDVSEDLEKHRLQKEYFHKVGLVSDFEVKLGRLIKTGSGEYRQKGVDIQISIDMLTKAFQNFFDVAVFVGGDDDFVDLINTVKNLTNKKVYGVAFQHSVSQRLLESFDISYIMDKEFCDNSVDVNAL